MIRAERSSQAPESLQKDDSQTNISEILIKSFGRKCAFCEQELDPELVKITHFDPSLNIESSLPQKWPNMYPSCPECKQAKGLKYPVLDGECLIFRPDHDHPEDYFIYNGFGYILPLNGDLRASVTIEAFRLNRPELLEQRHKVMTFVGSAFQNTLAAFRDRGGLTEELGVHAFEEWEKEIKVFFETLHRQINPKNAYAGLYRFMARHFIDLFRGLAKEDWQVKLLEDTRGCNAQQQPNQSFSALPQLSIRSVRLKNVRCFDGIQIDMDGANSLILGINGRGKSTILQTIALLCRGLKAPASNTPWEELVKIGHRSEATLEVDLVYNGRVIQLEGAIDAQNQLTFDNPDMAGLVTARLLIFGYGAKRTVARSEVPPNRRYETIASLFGENGHLKDIRDSAVYDVVSQKRQWFIHLINQILLLGDEQGKVRLTGFDVRTAWFETPTDHKGKTPLQAMSDGFRSTYAWLFDFLARVAEHSPPGDEPNAQDLSGIVLLDEIDLHLHPTWQRRLLPTLRGLFPKIQFIFTSHSPFVVQSMSEGKVFLLQHEGNAVQANQLQLDGTPDGHEIESIIKHTIALEGEIPSIGDELFEKLRIFQEQVRNHQTEQADASYHDLKKRLPADSGVIDFVELLHQRSRRSKT